MASNPRDGWRIGCGWNIGSPARVYRDELAALTVERDEARKALAEYREKLRAHHRRQNSGSTCHICTPEGGKCDL